MVALESSRPGVSIDARMLLCVFALSQRPRENKNGFWSSSHRMCVLSCVLYTIKVFIALFGQNIF